MKCYLILWFAVVCWCCTSTQASTRALEYEIATTWDNQTVSNNQTVLLRFTSDRKGLAIDIAAPLYKDQELSSAPPGHLENLYAYQTVDILFMNLFRGSSLELQFGPEGHYQAHLLSGGKDTDNTKLTLRDYSSDTSHKGKSIWTAKAIIPLHYFPSEVDHFNAFAIHGKGEHRQVLALFPVPFNSSDGPDLHDTSSYEPIDLSKLVAIRNVSMGENDDVLDSGSICLSFNKYLFYFVGVILTSIFLM